MGGAERQLAGLAEMLLREGLDTEVLTYRDGSFYSGSLTAAGVRHNYIPQRGGELRLISDIAAHLRENACEVLISFLAGTNIKACLVKRLCPGLRLIVSERNCNLRLQFHDRLRFGLYRRYADSIVCNSYAQSEFIRTYSPRLAGRIYTIPNFVDLERFRPATDKEKSHDGPFRVVTTARLSARKNALGLIKAAALCPGISFSWYGADKQDRYYQQCMHLISKLGLQARFHFYPSESNSEQLYSRFDAFCLPSFYEGTPNSLAEALACGLPVVCSRVSDNHRYISEGQNGYLVNPSDPSAIADALLRIASFSPEALAAAGLKSRRIAETAFRQESFVRRYMELLSGPKGGTKHNS